MHAGTGSRAALIINKLPVCAYSIRTAGSTVLPNRVCGTNVLMLSPKVAFSVRHVQNLGSKDLYMYADKHKLDDNFRRAT